MAAVARSLAAAVPICSSLGQLWAEYDGYRTSARIQELFDNLHREMGELLRAVGERSCKVDCSDFPELLELTIDAVRKEFDEAKRVKYARVLTRLVAGANGHSHDEKVSMIDSLDTLTETDLRVLSLFRDRSTCKIGDLEWASVELAGNLDDRLWQTAGSLARLESRGLILKVGTPSVVVFNSGKVSNEGARWLDTEYRLMPLGSSLMRVLFD